MLSHRWLLPTHRGKKKQNHSLFLALFNMEHFMNCVIESCSASPSFLCSYFLAVSLTCRSCRARDQTLLNHQETPVLFFFFKWYHSKLEWLIETKHRGNEAPEKSNFKSWRYIALKLHQEQQNSSLGIILYSWQTCTLLHRLDLITSFC